MTALRKADGGVRGIATGTSFRRLVAKSSARQFGQEVERVYCPFQIALSTRAGVDCVGHAVRTAFDLDPRATVLSIDGIGAYDHVLRSAMLGKLLKEENLRDLLPFVRMVYSHPSWYHWEDEDGCRKEIRQHEGERARGSFDAPPLLLGNPQRFGRGSVAPHARRTLVRIFR